jgi:hypothetical protein
MSQALNVKPSVPAAMAESAAILVVVPAAASMTKGSLTDVKAALSCPSPVIPLYLGKRNIEPPNPVLAMLDRVGGIDARAMEQAGPRELWRALAELLPPPRDTAPAGGTPNLATRIDWNEQVFSGLLAEAIKPARLQPRRFAADRVLRITFAHRPSPIAGARQSRSEGLEKERQFLLMRRYAAAALQFGTEDFEVRRQHARRRSSS